MLDIVNLPMSWTIVEKTLPNTYLELAVYTHGINTIVELVVLSHH